jgi:hypothetical protein
MIEGFVKNVKTNAIINTNTEQLNRILLERKKGKQFNEMVNEIAQLKKDVAFLMDKIK